MLILEAIIVIVALGIMALAACMLSSRISEQERLGMSIHKFPDPRGPGSYEVTGFDLKSHTIQRHPAKDPPPHPETAPGEASASSPGPVQTRRTL